MTEKSHGEHGPVTVTDKRGKARQAAAEASMDTRARGLDEPLSAEEQVGVEAERLGEEVRQLAQDRQELADAPSALDDALSRVDRIQALQEKGRAAMAGDGPSLTDDESRELLNLQAEQAAADSQASNTMQARTAFLVIIGHDGSAMATADVNTMLEIDGEASIDEMYAGVSIVQRDIEASLAAKHVVFGMQQGVQQLASRQRDIAAAAQLQQAGINPRQLRRR